MQNEYKAGMLRAVQIMNKVWFARWAYRWDNGCCEPEDFINDVKAVIEGEVAGSAVLIDDADDEA